LRELLQHSLAVSRAAGLRPTSPHCPGRRRLSGAQLRRGHWLLCLFGFPESPATNAKCGWRGPFLFIRGSCSSTGRGAR
jgi:hypothetical protein